MIVYIDGLSGLGKSTLVNTLKERKPEWISFKGAGAINIGMMKDWQDYNFRMRQIIERLDQCNDYKQVILWDRGLTDPVYSTDEYYTSEITRVIRSQVKTCAVLLTTTTPEDYLDLLNSRSDNGFTYKEGDAALDRWHDYDKIVSGMRHLKVNVDMKPDNYVDDLSVVKIIDYIESELKK